MSLDSEVPRRRDSEVSATRRARLTTSIVTRKLQTLFGLVVESGESGESGGSEERR